MTDQNGIQEAVRLLREGGLVAFPTETVYGLGADATNELAVRRLFSVKRRPADHPLIVHLADRTYLSAWAEEVPRAAAQLAEAFWPGPLTLILKRHGRVLDGVTGGLGTIALRVPQHPLALALLREFGGGVAAPSANRFGAVSPTTAQHVREDLAGEVDLVLDGGPCRVGVESTIIDLTQEIPRVVRPGGVTADALEAVLDEKVAVGAPESQRVSGNLSSHYAPKATVELVTVEQLSERLEVLLKRRIRLGVLLSPDVSERVNAFLPAQSAAEEPELVPCQAGEVCVAQADSTEGYAQKLYALLRRFDVVGCDLIVAVAPSAPGLGSAVLDRLRRAAGPRDGTLIGEVQQA